MYFQIVQISLKGVHQHTGIDTYFQEFDRYRKGLKKQTYSSIRVFITNDDSFLSCRTEESEGLFTLWFSLPNIRNALSSTVFSNRIVPHLFHKVQSFLDKGSPTVISLHSYQLIDLAFAFKKALLNSKIITHLHHIPWKALFNEDRTKFNKLYKSHLSKKHLPIIVSKKEELAYEISDKLVCLTRDAQCFLRKVSPKGKADLEIIPNGLSDFFERSNLTQEKEALNVIFVGSLVPSKGLQYLLDAIRIVQNNGICLSLAIVGSGSIDTINNIKKHYKDLDIEIHGLQSQYSVLELYKQSDIGIIASLQEQCSYVALEMAMMSLPIITTAVDGLDEMFTDGVNALKVPVSFSRVRGLSPDVAYMAECILRLARDKSLRARLGHGARALYLGSYTLEKMGRETVKMYEDILKSDE